MNILVPLAAKSSFFPASDYPFPKPLIEVGGVTMIERVIESLKVIQPNANFIFVVNREDASKFSLDRTLKLLAGPSCKIVSLANGTEGALCSCLMAVDCIDPSRELIISNGDQVISSSLVASVNSFRQSSATAGVICFESVHPRWSYVKEGAQGEVLQAEEKQVISKHAIAGFYYFSKGKHFVEAAKACIVSGRSVEGKYFIAPALNELILEGRSVKFSKIPNSSYHSFYSPTKITEFEEFYLKRPLANNESVEHIERNVTEVLIPAAGDGSRFAIAGYSKPKPFIDVLGRSMIEHVIDNVSVSNSQITLLFQEKHIASNTETVRALERAGCRVVPVVNRTEGTACTVLLARDVIDSSNSLLIANSDQLVEFDCQEFVQDCLVRGLDGSILVFRDSAKDPKWSFAKIDEQGLVTEVAEKRPISNLATVGIYFFARSSDFIDAAIDMIARNDRVNGEFYTCPTYNYMLKRGKRIGIYEIEEKAMSGLGTPEDLNSFLDKQTSCR